MRIKTIKWLCFVLILALFLPGLAIAADEGQGGEVGGYEDLNEKFADILDIYMTYHLDQPTDAELLRDLMAAVVDGHPELFDELVDSMINHTDRYNNFFTAEEYKLAFYPPDYVGIGVRVSQEADEAYVRIIEVFSNSPAKDAGIRAGDLIVAVDGENVSGFGIERTGILIRGERGTSVSITIERDSSPLTLDIERKEIRTDSVTHERIEDICYISVRDFQDFTVFLRFYSILRDESAAGAKGFIIDLRNNTGGDVDTALNMANCFLTEDDVVLATFYNYDETSYTVSSVQTGLNITNAVVLVNENSYSSSEVMAGILKDLGLATIVGEKTGGKGRGQNHIELKDGSVVTVTTSEVELPKSGKYHGVGITPDLTVKNDIRANHVPDLLPMNYEGVCKIGDTGGNIPGLGQRLWILGYLKGAGGQIYDQRMADAVGKFQEKHSLTPDGAAAFDTLKAVDQAILDYMNEEIYVDMQLEKALELVQKGAR